jgi:cytochrome b involved in lipid metabolism
MNKFFSIFIFAALIFLSGCGQKVAELAPTATSTLEDGKKGIPMETVAEHASAEDCWMVINNNVYNVTDFVASHPGGKSMIGGCGKDASELFETRPMGSKTPHSDRARDIMSKYYIGDLKR